MGWLIDANLRFVRSGHPCYLRLRNFPDQQNKPYSQLGFSVSPSGNALGQTGYQDVLISPPPSVIPSPSKNVGRDMGKLRFGSTIFGISHTFIAAQAAAMGITEDKYDVWLSTYVLGIYYEHTLFSIDSIKRRVVGSQTIFWNILASSNELR
jgi:hypothetical protein